MPENEKDSIRVIFQDMQTLRLSPVAELRDFAECVNALQKTGKGKFRRVADRYKEGSERSG